jgi:hypothetical protein
MLVAVVMAGNLRTNLVNPMEVALIIPSVDIREVMERMSNPPMLQIQTPLETTTTVLEGI